jgi:hypothetical protein
MNDNLPVTGKCEIPLKFNIILKPGVLDKPGKKHGAAKKDRLALSSVIPPSVELISPMPIENRFTRKLCNIIDAVTFCVNDYIIHNLDNESASDQYKIQIRNGLGKIRDDFVASRANPARGAVLDSSTVAKLGSTSPQINLTI